VQSLNTQRTSYIFHAKDVKHVWLSEALEKEMNECIRFTPGIELQSEMKFAYITADENINWMNSTYLLSIVFS
jgi:hypothetical protein